ncbi:MAG: hypothetical protein KDB69_09920 [Acidimicrobiia bacterium]|nr:hypothetical protein [Acidimicrobiia bacterium]
MIPPGSTTEVGVWVSRLACPPSLGAPSVDAFGSEGGELPTVAGVPVRGVAPVGSPVVVFWPNIAGCLEPIEADDDLVVWDRSLAPAPHRGCIVPYREHVDDIERGRTERWFRKLMGHCSQIRGIRVAVPTDTARVILSGPSRPGLDGAPPGIVRLPSHLTEFRAAVLVTSPLDRDPTRYAADVVSWVRRWATEEELT